MSLESQTKRVDALSGGLLTSAEAIGTDATTLIALTTQIRSVGNLLQKLATTEFIEDANPVTVVQNWLNDVPVDNEAQIAGVELITSSLLRFYTATTGRQIRDNVIVINAGKPNELSIVIRDRQGSNEKLNPTSCVIA